MGAPHTEIGASICRVAEQLEHATEAEINDTIRGLNRTGMPFKTIHRDDLKILKESMLVLKGFITAVKETDQHATETAEQEWNHIYGDLFE